MEELLINRKGTFVDIESLMSKEDFNKGGHFHERFDNCIFIRRLHDAIEFPVPQEKQQEDEHFFSLSYKYHDYRDNRCMYLELGLGNADFRDSCFQSLYADPGNSKHYLAQCLHSAICANQTLI